MGIIQYFSSHSIGHRLGYRCCCRNCYDHLYQRYPKAICLFGHGLRQSDVYDRRHSWFRDRQIFFKVYGLGRSGGRHRCRAPPGEDPPPMVTFAGSAFHAATMSCTVLNGESAGTRMPSCSSTIFANAVAFDARRKQSRIRRYIRSHTRRACGACIRSRAQLEIRKSRHVLHGAPARAGFERHSGSDAPPAADQGAPREGAEDAAGGGPVKSPASKRRRGRRGGRRRSGARAQSGSDGDGE